MLFDCIVRRHAIGVNSEGVALCKPVPSKAGKALTKTLLIMRMTAFLLLIACMQVSAKGYSQITLAETNTPLAKVFQKIEKQSGYLFWYNDALLQRARKVDINVTNATLQQVLDICFKA